MVASLAERGLLLSMFAHAWMNGTVPANTGVLARMFSLSVAEIDAAFGGLIKDHFQPVPNDETRLFCPEFERQKERFLKIRAQQAAGGRMTAKARREAAANKANSGARLATSLPSSSAVAPELNGSEANRGFQGKGLGEHEEWLQDYDGQTTSSIS